MTPLVFVDNDGTVLRVESAYNEEGAPTDCFDEIYTIHALIHPDEDLWLTCSGFDPSQLHRLH